jgi:hypothetical protein
VGLQYGTATPEYKLEHYESVDLHQGTAEDYFAELLQMRIDGLRDIIAQIPDHLLGNGWAASSIKAHRDLLSESVRMLEQCGEISGEDYGRWIGESVKEFEFEGTDYCVC